MVKLITAQDVVDAMDEVYEFIDASQRCGICGDYIDSYPHTHTVEECEKRRGYACGAPEDHHKPVAGSSDAQKVANFLNERIADKDQPR